MELTLKLREAKKVLPKAELLHPIPELGETRETKYYLIYPVGFQPMLAMYMVNEGEKGWYKDYTSKLVIDVQFWVDLDNIKEGE